MSNDKVPKEELYAILVLDYSNKFIGKLRDILNMVELIFDLEMLESSYKSNTNNIEARKDSLNIEIITAQKYREMKVSQVLEVQNA